MSRGGWSISSSEPMRRRGALSAGALLLLGACGFRPLHAPGGAAGADPGIAADLAATRVPVIPERFGQLMRRGLQQRLGRGGETAPRYELVVQPSLSAEGIGILRDGAATRVRYQATASWTLFRVAPRAPLANGFERAMDAFNIQPNQFFAADASREAAERRLAEALAEEVVLRLAMRLRAIRDGAPASLIEPVAPPPTLPDPAAPQGLGGALPSPGEGGGLGGGIGPLEAPR